MNEESLGHLASTVRGQINALARRMRQETSVDAPPLSQLIVLGAIDRMGGSITPTELSIAERLRSSNLATVLRKLEAEGNIRRCSDPRDGRKSRILLTAKGKRILYGNRGKREQWLSHAIRSCLNEEERARLADAGHLLEKLARHPAPADMQPVAVRPRTHSC